MSFLTLTTRYGNHEHTPVCYGVGLALRKRLPLDAQAPNALLETLLRQLWRMPPC